MGFDKRYHILYISFIYGMLDTEEGGKIACLIEKNGQLKQLPKSSTFYNTDGGKVSPPESISLTPNGQYAYVPEGLHDRGDAAPWRDVVAQYRTGPGGVLRPLSPETVPVETAADSFIESNGLFLYLLYEKADADGVTAHYRLAYASIGLKGRLGKFTYQTLGKGPQPAVQPFSLAFDHMGRFCYFVEGHYLYAFRVQVNGSLTPLHPSRIDAGYGPLGVVCIQR